MTFFYSGRSPVAPGTMGSLVAIPPALLVLHYLPPSTLFLLALFITLVAIREINVYEKQSNTHDDKKIVIDEVAGMWVALSLSGFSIAQVVLSFVFFRLLDIYKPSYIGKIDKNVKGGLGVMGDDLLAGVLAGLLSALFYTYLYQPYLAIF